MNLIDFYSGIKKGFPIALGYLPIAIAFGLLAKIAGLPVSITILMSVLVFAGASQFIAINLLLTQTNYWQIIIAIFIINLRHFLMSASLSQKISKKAKKLLPLIAFGITDETFSLISLNLHVKDNLSIILGINFIAYSGWVVGTVIGAIVGKGLPVIIQASMGIALYVMFIGLLIPGIKKSRKKLSISLIAMGLSSLLYWGPAAISSISRGWQIIITTISACTIGAIIFPEKDTTNEE